MTFWGPETARCADRDVSRVGPPPRTTEVGATRLSVLTRTTTLNEILGFNTQFPIYLAPKSSRIWIFSSVLKTICANGTMFLLMPFKGQIFKKWQITLFVASTCGFMGGYKYCS